MNTKVPEALLKALAYLKMLLAYLKNVRLLGQKEGKKQKNRPPYCDENRFLWYMLRFYFSTAELRNCSGVMP